MADHGEARRDWISGCDWRGVVRVLLAIVGEEEEVVVSNRDCDDEGAR